MDQKKLCALIEHHEGYRSTAYDDATGEPIIPGYTMKGYPTVGIGLNLATHGIGYTSAKTILRDIVETIEFSLSSKQYWHALCEARRAALIDMVFNLGLRGFSEFRKLEDALNRFDYEQASKEILDSTYSKQVGNRARTIAEMIRTGLWPEVIIKKTD